MTVASVNGTITLILLLIAPLGLAAVIFNTLLVAFSTFVVCSLSDGIITWLSLSPSIRRSIHSPGELTQRERTRKIQRRENSDFD